MIFLSTIYTWNFVSQWYWTPFSWRPLLAKTFIFRRMCHKLCHQPKLWSVENSTSRPIHSLDFFPSPSSSFSPLVSSIGWKPSDSSQFSFLMKGKVVSEKERTKASIIPSIKLFSHFGLMRWRTYFFALFITPLVSINAPVMCSSFVNIKGNECIYVWMYAVFQKHLSTKSFST